MSAPAARFVCVVCFEERAERLELSQLKTGNGEVMRNEDCGHPICRDCMAAYVIARVEEQLVFGIRCPHEGCHNQLYEKDVEKLVKSGHIPVAVHDRFAELRARDFSARAKEFTEEMAATMDNYELLKKLWESTRLCPRCHVAIERSTGCNSFYCICGHHFNYATAPRPVGNGVKRYDWVLTMAKNCQLPLSEAEYYGGDSRWYSRVCKIAAQLKVPLEEAKEVDKLARAGDKEAIARIRRAREVASQEALEDAWDADGDDDLVLTW